MQIVILDGYAVNPGDLSYEAFEKLGQLTVYDRTPADQLIKRIYYADAILTERVALGPEQLVRCPKLKYVGLLGQEDGRVDLAAAALRGITVTDVPDEGGAYRGEMALALLLEITRNVGLHDRSVHAGRWSHSPDYRCWEAPQLTLKSKTLGILGAGESAGIMAHVCRALGMTVIVWDQTKIKGFKGDYAPMEKLLAQSDVISLHCGQSRDNRGLIDHESLRLIKPGAILINAEEGTLINETEVAEALNSRRLYAYGADRAACEPISSQNPLLKARNCYLTPHLGDAPIENRRRILAQAAENLEAFQAGKPIRVLEAGKEKQ